MKTAYFIIVAFLSLGVTVHAQNGARTFDNFDRSQGVQVVSPPIIPMAKSNKKLVKKTGQSKAKSAIADASAKRGARSGWVVSVRDNLTDRETVTPVSRLMMGSSPHLKGFTTGNLQHDTYIVDSSRRYGIDPLLIYSQMHQESSFKINATSNKGASGLMQLMPATARRFGVTKIYDPQQNIDAGVKYMRWLLDTFNGDVVLALAGYNAGEGAVMKYGWNVPPYRETQEYVRRISARYNSISNPQYVQSARRVNNATAAKMEKIESRPLTVIEPDAKTIRLPNGKMILVNQ